MNANEIPKAILQKDYPDPQTIPVPLPAANTACYIIRINSRQKYVSTTARIVYVKTVERQDALGSKTIQVFQNQSIVLLDELLDNVNADYKLVIFMMSSKLLQYAPTYRYPQVIINTIRNYKLITICQFVSGLCKLFIMCYFLIRSLIQIRNRRL
jgi:hypothetical protein